jgi:acetyl/propionyl-CoA carboxylase alpha subunit/acetyl-CoA carboxylase carboxyltransferase component
VTAMATINRLAIVNRGAAAMRLINAAREYAAEHDRDIQIVALHTEADAGALFVREADLAVRVEGPITADNLEAIAEALTSAGADAAWVGWGPLAQQPAFAEMCGRLGITNVGLGAAALAGLADRSALQAAAEAAGGRLSPLDIVDTGYARHIEVLVVGDRFGDVWAVGVHDGTMQRRSEKVLVETAGPALIGVDDDLLRSVATRVASLSGVMGAATVAFVREGPTSEVTLLRISGGLPLGHGVTEIGSGIDLAKLQLHIAEGGRLTGAAPRADGHAIAVRLIAEDAELGFAPAPGRVDLFQVPTGPGMRIDAAVSEGDVVRPGDDTTLAEVVAWGRDRDEARVRLRRALAQLPVVLEGGTTNKGFLLDLLDRPEMRSGTYDTGWLDRLAAAGETVGREHGETAVLMAAIDAYDERQRSSRSQLFATARRGRPHVSNELGRHFELCHRGNEYAVFVRRSGRRQYRVAVDGAEIGLVVTRLGRYQSRLDVGGRSRRIVSAIQSGDHLVEVDGVPHRLSRGDGGIVRCSLPGVVVAIHVAVGDEVAANETLVTIESMKMESQVVAPFAGRVRQVSIGTNVQVDSGAALVHLEPLSRGRVVLSEPRCTFSQPVDDAAVSVESRFARNLDTLTRLVMGYDVAAAAARRVADDQAAIAQELAADSPERVAGELRLLGVFADLRALFRSERDVNENDITEADLLVTSPQEYLHAFLRSPGPAPEGVPPHYLLALERALAHYGIRNLEHTDALEEALYWIMQSRQRIDVQLPVIIAVLNHWMERPVSGAGEHLRETLDRLVAATQRDHPVVADLAREVRFEAIDRPVVDAARHEVLAAALERLDRLVGGEGERSDHLAALVACTQPMEHALLDRARDGGDAMAAAVAEVLSRRHHRWGTFGEFALAVGPSSIATVSADHASDVHGAVHLVATCAPYASLPDAVSSAVAALASAGSAQPGLLEIYTWLADADEPLADDAIAAAVLDALATHELGDSLQYVVVAVAGGETSSTGEPGVRHVTFRPTPLGLVEDRVLRGLHPMMAARLRLWRFANFDLERVASTPGIHLFRAIAHGNASDERLFAVAEVRDLTPVRNDVGRLIALPELERTLLAAMEAIRRVQAPRPLGKRLWWNRIVLPVWPPVTFTSAEIETVAAGLSGAAAGLGLEEVQLLCRRLDEASGEMRDVALRFTTTTGTGFVLTETEQPTEPLTSLDEYTRKVVQSRRRGTVYPYELIRGLVAAHAGGREEITGGTFVEYDLDEVGRLVQVQRPPGCNLASLVVGVVSNMSARYPEGMARVALLGDPTRALGALAEPECVRIMAAIDLAEQMGVPLEWYALSAGAKIAMDSGTENMDWIADVLRRIIEFTQHGGEINVVVTGINVGAQPYWNAEATMLMHTKGILVMTPDSAMVLTGKQALDFSGGVSAEDNHGIGGYERVMGPNGQAQYWAPDVPAACGVLLAHYAHSYAAPGERFPRRAPTTDPFDRDVRSARHHLEGSDLTTVGDIFSERSNPDRKKPFDIRSVMRAVLDADHQPLERWADLAESDTAVVWDGHLGGIPVCTIGIEAHALARHGRLPADGPNQWTSGTLFPMSSKKIARAVNAASGSQPLLVLANLSGFDGSPESMRRTQLEFGAEIGRAVVNFRGPVVFCVVSRFHGGAFVVFSQKLNPMLETLAVEGSHASVIGGSPAAAVVFAGEVDKRTRADARVVELEARIAAAAAGERAALRSELVTTLAQAHSDQLGAVAAEFDAIHSVERALAVGSVSRIIPAGELRPLLIDAVERGMAREIERWGGQM